MITANILLAFGNLCVGPSQVFGLPNKFWIMALGQIFHGILEPFMYVPCLPEMIDSVKHHYPPEYESEINDMLAGVFTMINGLGQMLGPIYGSVATAQFGFRLSSDQLTFMLFAFGICYVLFGKEKKVTVAPGNTDKFITV